MLTPVTYVRVTETTVCVLPEDSINHHSYAVRVQWRGGETYAVVHMGYCLGADGTWEYEVNPSAREDEWIQEHRFSYQEAYQKACEVAPTVEVNGRTAVEIAAQMAGAS